MIWSGIPSLCGQTSNFRCGSNHCERVPFCRAKYKPMAIVYVGMLQLFAWSRRNVNLEHQNLQDRIILQFKNHLPDISRPPCFGVSPGFTVSCEISVRPWWRWSCSSSPWPSRKPPLFTWFTKDRSMDRWIGHRVTLWKFEDWDVWDVWDVGVGNVWKEFLAGSSLEWWNLMNQSFLCRGNGMGIYFWSLDAAGTGDTGDTTKLMRYWSSILGWSRLEQWKI